MLSALVLSLAAAAPAPLEDVFAKVDAAVVLVRVGEKNVVDTPRRSAVELTVSTGSGVLVHRDGYVVTAGHVVEDAAAIVVAFRDGVQASAEVVTLSHSEDLALLKVDEVSPKAAVAPLGDSDGLKVGQRIFAIGAPLGFEHTLTAGVVSALRSNPSPGLPARRLVQTDVALNQGNSGCPLFNEAGEVVGIASFIASTTGGSIGLNFAVPSNTVRARLFEQALPYLGVSLRFIPREVAELFNWPVEGAFLVEKVRAGSAADEAGLRGGVLKATVAEREWWLGGDVLLKVGEVDTSTPDKVGAYLRTLKAGDVVKYTVLRGGRPGTVEVKVPKLPPVPALPRPGKK